MAKLPTKRDLTQAATIAPGGAQGVRAPGVNTNPNASNAPQLNIDIMGEEVIPRLPNPNFSAERQNIARLEESTAKAKGSSLINLGKELGHIKLDIDAAKERQDTLEALTANSALSVTLADIEYEAAKQPPHKRAAYRAARLKTDLPEIYNSITDDRVKEKVRLTNESKVHDFTLDGLTKDEVAEREKDKVNIYQQLDALRTQMLTAAADNPESQADILAQMQGLIYKTDVNGLALFEPKESYRLNEIYLTGMAEEAFRAMIETNPKRAMDAGLGREGAKKFLGKNESGGQYHKMELTGSQHAGKYQFSGARLVDLGLYEFAQGEGYSDERGWYGNKWQGKWTFPPSMKINSLKDYLGSSEAQEYAFERHLDKAEDTIEERGWDKYVGANYNGTIVTRAGLFAAIHISGSGGTAAFLAGGDSPADVNGTTAGVYMREAQAYDWINANMDPAKRKVLQDKATKSYLYQQLIANIDEGNAGEEEIQKASEMGWLDDPDKVQAARNRIKAAKTRFRAEIGAQRLGEFGEKFNPKDPETVNQMGAVAEKYGIAEGMMQGSPDAVKNYLEMYKKSHIVPSNVKGALENMLTSGNPATVELAAGALTEMNIASPFTYDTNISDRMAATAAVYGRLKSIYTDPDELHSKVMDYLSPQKLADMEEYKKKADDVIDDIDVAAAFDDSSWYEGWSGAAKRLIPFYSLYATEKTAREGVLSAKRFFTGEEAPGEYAQPVNEKTGLPRGIKAAYKRIFTDELARLEGDVEGATKAANALVRKRYGPSKVGGVVRITEYPIEQRYAFANEHKVVDTDWIDKQAREYLMERGVLKEGQKFYLEADPETHKEIMRGELPHYTPMIIDEYGQATKAVVTPIEGVDYRYVPRWAPDVEPELRRIKKAEAEAFEKSHLTFKEGSAAKRRKALLDASNATKRRPAPDSVFGESTGAGFGE